MKKIELKDLAELIEFRKSFIKEKHIMYLNYKILEEAILKNQIFGEFENSNLVGYVWFINLVRKPFCKIEEICSKNKSGYKLLKFVELHSKHEIIRLSVVDFNSKAISFYKRNNFLEIGKREGKITNIIMEKNIYESRNI